MAKEIPAVKRTSGEKTGGEKTYRGKIGGEKTGGEKTGHHINSKRSFHPIQRHIQKRVKQTY